MQVCCSSVSSQMIVASEDLSTKRKRYIIHTICIHITHTRYHGMQFIFFRMM